MKYKQYYFIALFYLSPTIINRNKKESNNSIFIKQSYVLFRKSVVLMNSMLLMVYKHLVGRGSLEVANLYFDLI